MSQCAYAYTRICKETVYCREVLFAERGALLFLYFIVRHAMREFGS